MDVGIEKVLPQRLTVWKAPVTSVAPLDHLCLADGYEDIVSEEGRLRKEVIDCWDFRMLSVIPLVED